MSKTVVITGANRGIGLAFTKHYLNEGAKVFAVCRASSNNLSVTRATVIDGIDVSSATAIDRLRGLLNGERVDLLINNAGVLQDEVLGQIDYASIQSQFEVNALGPLRVTEALAPNLAAHAKVAMITSRMGSIADNTSGGRYGYRMSKVALNMAAVSIAHDLASKGIAVGIYHPGLVGTDMIRGHGDITPDQAVQQLARRIDELSLADSGGFWHSNGEVLPW